MTPLDYIRVDADILRLDLSSSEKLILGAVKNLNGRGLMLPNDEIAKMIGTRADTVSKILARLESQKLICFKNKQSRFRKIYFGENAKVTPDVLREKPQSKPVYTLEKNPVTLDFNPITLEKSPNIIEGIQKIKDIDHSTEESITPERFIEHWNAFDKLPAVRAFSKERRGKLAARAKEETFREHWREIIRKLAGSAFHTGQNDRGWRASVDWILKNDTNYLKILELPDLMDGVTREADATEIDKLLGTDENE